MINGRPAWKSFRELVVPKWSEAFRHAIIAATGSKQFTYIVAVAHVKGSTTARESNEQFLEAMDGNPIRIISLHQMIDQINSEMKTTLAATEVGRRAPTFPGGRL
ncbi:MAG: hypothetical protein P4L80_16395 [Xanthobacteraceae bacterium]|nr:hypothetical protein [Xanthobacteraceae bacterium]